MPGDGNERRRARAFTQSEQLHLTVWALTQWHYSPYIPISCSLKPTALSQQTQFSRHSDMCDPTRDDGSSQTRVVLKEKRPYFLRKWLLVDVIRMLTVVIVHFLCLLAPFHYTWEALRFGLVLFVLTELSITFSYHRNLAHRNSDRDPHSPKEGLWFSHVLWIFDILYIKYKCGGRNNVMDLKQQWFYRWLSLFTMGESWHNNHHAFESSARQGLEWWQIDITWYLIRLFEVLGLATDVKLPSEFQKQKMAIPR
ncbi:unnamed protein product [Thlaspi arvense]|uniref:Fatty acid desaturase domain-containing protein n=1 Tax=Thlaspi arvense TaxID=13288 RepID=A0AAU9RH71_THLAR|nr:unnamed protein product [Thlaspi arvense]